MAVLSKSQFLALTDLSVGQFDMMRARNQIPLMTNSNTDQSRDRGVYVLEEVVMTLVARNLTAVYNLDRGLVRGLVASNPELVVRYIEEADKSNEPLWYLVAFDGNHEPWLDVSTWDQLPKKLSFDPREISSGTLRRICLVDLTAIAAHIKRKAAEIKLHITSWSVV